MKAAVYDRCGEPADVLSVRDVSEITPGRNEVRIRMIASPINPSDIMTVRGMYGRGQKLPATPGYEGVGVVDAVGGGLLAKIRGLRPGRRVAVLHGAGGAWQESVVIPARQAVPVPDDIPDDQVASFFVNPATVIVMAKKVLEAHKHGWLAQSAGGSSLGRMIIRLGKQEGFKTISTVRRSEWIPELKKLGADHVLVTGSCDVGAEIQRITGGKLRCAIDCVGGSTGFDLVRGLGPNGRLLVYGTLSNEPIPLNPRELLTGEKKVEGFWLSEWVKRQSVWGMLSLFGEITRGLKSGVFHTPVEAEYPLEKIAEAVKHAERPGRDGKILLRITATPKS